MFILYNMLLSTLILRCRGLLGCKLLCSTTKVPIVRSILGKDLVDFLAVVILIDIVAFLV